MKRTPLTRILISLRTEELDAVDAACRQSGDSRSSIVRRVIRDQLLRTPRSAPAGGHSAPRAGGRSLVSSKQTLSPDANPFPVVPAPDAGLDSLLSSLDR